MARAIFPKLLQYILAFGLIVAGNFALIHAMPGDPLVHLVGEEGYSYLSAGPPEALAALRERFGLGQPLPRQLAGYFSRAVSGDFGWSYHHGRPVGAVIGESLSWTLVLLIPAVCLSSLIGGWAGAVAGWPGASRSGKIRASLALFLYSVPVYCLAMVVLVFVWHTGILPAGGMMGPDPGGVGDVIRHALAPLAVLVLHASAYKFMVMRNAVRQELGSAYVLTAVSKGLSRRRILFGHILPNTLGPYISVVALHVGFMTGGALLVEVVFSWQGMGTLIYEAAMNRDYPLLSGSLMALSASVIAANALADLCHGLIDPRIREGRPLD